MRLLQFLRQVRQTCDRTVWVMLIPLAAIAAWLLLLPFSSTVQRATLRRFQMQTPTFWQWAVQQPIPAMYNAENRAQVILTEPTGDGTLNGERRFAAPRYLNHFPFRLVTFGDGRFDFLRFGQPVAFHLESSYRGHRLETHWRATPRQEGGGHVIALQEAREE